MAVTSPGTWTRKTMSATGIAISARDGPFLPADQPHPRLRQAMADLTI
jgi:hypothetical protein